MFSKSILLAIPALLFMSAIAIPHVEVRAPDGLVGRDHTQSHSDTGHTHSHTHEHEHKHTHSGKTVRGVRDVLMMEVQSRVRKLLPLLGLSSVWRRQMRRGVGVRGEVIGVRDGEEGRCSTAEVLHPTGDVEAFWQWSTTEHDE